MFVKTLFWLSLVFSGRFFQGGLEGDIYRGDMGSVCHRIAAGDHISQSDVNLAREVRDYAGYSYGNGIFRALEEAHKYPRTFNLVCWWHYY